MAHCKGPDHLKVVVTPAQTTQAPLASYQAKMPCVNAGATWGVQMNLRPKKPLTGMYLLPEAVKWLPQELRTAANGCTGMQTVSIFHTTNQQLTHFVALTPAGARKLADDIDQVAP